MTTPPHIDHQNSMTDLTTHDIEKKRLEACETERDKLRHGCRTVLDCIEKMEQVKECRDKTAVPHSTATQLWDVFLQGVRHLIHTEICSLFLADENGDEFVLEQVVPEDQRKVCQDEIACQIEHGMLLWIVRRKKPAVVPSLVFKEQKTILLIPLCTAPRSHGVVLVLTPVDQKSITQETLRLLATLAKGCSLMIDNTFLYDQLRIERKSLLDAEAQILQAKKLASFGRLIAGTFHEILNPLNIVSGYVQLLSRERGLDKRVSRYLAIMESQCDRIGRIVKRLLELSKFPKEQKGEVWVNDVIEKVFSLVEFETAFDGVRIVQELDRALPAIVADEEKLSQLFFNLFCNAWDSMPKGGTLKITTSLATDGNDGSSNSDHIAVTFKGTGCKIPKAYSSKISDPLFFARTQGAGTGLGLSVSYGIIQEHGGTIDIKGAINEGTTVTVCLPCGSISEQSSR